MYEHGQVKGGRYRRTETFLYAFFIVILSARRLCTFKETGKHDVFRGGEEEDEGGGTNLVMCDVCKTDKGDFDDECLLIAQT